MLWTCAFIDPYLFLIIKDISKSFKAKSLNQNLLDISPVLSIHHIPLEHGRKENEENGPLQMNAVWLQIQGNIKKHHRITEPSCHCFECPHLYIPKHLAEPWQFMMFPDAFLCKSHQETGSRIYPPWFFLAFLSRVVMCDDQFHSDGNSKEPVTIHLLHLSSTDGDRGMCLCLLFSQSDRQSCPTSIHGHAASMFVCTRFCEIRN